MMGKAQAVYFWQSQIQLQNKPMDAKPRDQQYHTKPCGATTRVQVKRTYCVILSRLSRELVLGLGLGY